MAIRTLKSMLRVDPSLVAILVLLIDLSTFPIGPLPSVRQPDPCVSFAPNPAPGRPPTVRPRNKIVLIPGITGGAWGAGLQGACLAWSENGRNLIPKERLSIAIAAAHNKTQHVTKSRLRP
jgi:hypothetical protein